MIALEEPRGAAALQARSLLLNLRAGARLALFLPVRAQDFRGTPAAAACLVAFNMAFWLLVSWADAGFSGSLDPAALPGYLAGFALVLLAALLVCAVYGRPELVSLVVVALSASDPVFELAALPLGLLAEAGPGAWIYLAFLAWAWAVALRAVAVCLGRMRRPLLRAALVVTAVMALAYHVVPRTEVWIAPGEETPPPALADERTFHRQGELIERALEAIEPGRRGRPDLYFAGFAPDASQDVFLREMRFVKGQFDERFRTAGRSIVLASSTDALEELPIGSVTNLGRALRRIGAVMDAEEDILFLFLTAHGDRAHRLSAVQPPLSLASLTPTALARLLHEAGIRWRVIVVSACYSGGYIEPLRDDNSVIITAASPERTSFGCEHGRDFTYFGEAYFKEALARTGSFVEAFRMAREAVTAREKAEGLVPSEPQIAVGAAIAAQLQKLAEQPDGGR